MYLSRDGYIDQFLPLVLIGQGQILVALVLLPLLIKKKKLYWNISVLEMTSLSRMYVVENRCSHKIEDHLE